MNTTPHGPPAAMDVYARAQTLAPISASRRLNLCITGEGPITVVLAAGYLGITLDWALVQHRLSRRFRVVSFDNAGLGFSDPGPEPRTSSAIVSDLRAALAAAQLGPPYILVGHSAGGIRMRLFAAHYLQDCLGLVMVDSCFADWEQRLYGGPSPHLDQEREVFQRLLERAEAGRLTPEAADYKARIAVPRSDLSPAMNATFHDMWTRPSYLRTAISESLHLRASTAIEAAADKKPLGQTPLAVLSATDTTQSAFLENAAQTAAWFGMHDELADLSERGFRRLVDCGHNIPIEHPKAVVAAVEEVAAMAG
ncbi:MAG: alpha/beta hydrolase [Phenylobacterium sp.]|uniref:alpha/beta fold hydrolase n=1 Tax=Phenylobacterium sp. TaxID=1871053 RepID=UPI0025E4299F|nr:alpha/beta fold hydrolase [Phenylobacterium sp.]MCG9915175.1 alpha/beta hydrolase [Phenylobacterium sp.]